jgi:hypothetical protein
MVPAAVDAAVQSALANQQYDRVAAILDAAELEVCNRRNTHTGTFIGRSNSLTQ